MSGLVSFIQETVKCFPDRLAKHTDSRTCVYLVIVRVLLLEVFD